MTSYSIKINDHFIHKIYDEYQNCLIPSNNKNIQYIFKINHDTLTIYHNKTILIQSKANMQYWLDYFAIKPDIYQFNDHYEYEIGSDETGVGDFFGGLVVCAVKINKNQFNLIQEKFAIKDSKKLSKVAIMQLYEELIKIVDYKICAFDPIKYNEFIHKTDSNTHYVKAFLHNDGLNHLACDHSLIIVDQFVNEKKYYEYLKKLKVKKITFVNIFETKAESKYLSVAIAAIIARGWYLTQINHLSNKLGIELPLGAWNEKIKNTALLIQEKYGKETLLKISKNDFKVKF